MIKKFRKLPKVSTKKVIAIVLTASIIASIGYLAIMQRRMNRLLNEISNDKVGALILDAVENLNKPLAIDAKTGDSYMPEARLMIPGHVLPSNRLEYAYTASSDDFPEEVRLSSVSAVNTQRVKILSATSFEKLFAEVPALQACARGFKLTFEAAPLDEDGMTLVFEKDLHDGRHLVVRNENGCAMPDYFDIEYLKLIDSY